ncbi:short-chain dehydrogenase TIC chloroplastic-like [Brachionus plicatilis]|uniref:Short-chain dehydrogenase TIC chloroplastic-like n=1 Tax=Brachionus plicatilis TaxID=10195 RepID=A0A3M7S994_BRAPC|nr:short-chain dehydrogenase TIC chloroplastic-like [Brachionus plicatilis]
MAEKKFDDKTRALEVIQGHDLNGYEIIVTGASSGIGIETARVLAQAGARIILAARDTKKLESVADDIRQYTDNQNVEIEKLELDSLSSVGEFVKRYLAKNRPLHILINNAGIMACPKAFTKDGFELQFGTNHMGHFALTLGLIPALKHAAQLSGRKSRVVSVSSLAHIFADVDLEDINFKNRNYDPWVAYGQSKTANVLFSIALTKLYQNEGIVSNSLMPGVILTGLQKHLSKEEKVKFNIEDEKGNPNPNFKTVEQGASTTVWAAVASELEGKGGLYLENCGYSELKESSQEAHKSFLGYVKYAVDEEKAMKLWNISKEWLKNPPKLDSQTEGMD